MTREKRKTIEERSAGYAPFDGPYVILDKHNPFTEMFMNLFYECKGNPGGSSLNQQELDNFFQKMITRQCTKGEFNHYLKLARVKGMHKYDVINGICQKEDREIRPVETVRDPNRFQERLENRRKWSEEYERKEEEKRKKEDCKGLLKAIGIATSLVIGFGSQFYLYGLHLNKEAKQQAIEDTLRSKRGYGVTSANEAIRIRRSGTSNEPTTTASYRGVDYLFKIGKNGVPYFEPTLPLK